MIKPPKHLYSRIIWLVVLLAAAITAEYLLPVRPAATATAASSLSGHADVRDGDTLVVNNVRIRLAHIDAPELDQDCTRGNARWRCGQAAKDLLTTLINQRPVRCTLTDQDHHNRAVGQCYLGELHLNREMVRRGMALAYRYHSTEFVTDEDAARRNKAGLHGAQYTPPRMWRTQHPRH